MTDPEDLINYYSDSLPNRPIKKSKTIVDDMTDDEKKCMTFWQRAVNR